MKKYIPIFTLLILISGIFIYCVSTKNEKGLPLINNNDTSQNKSSQKNKTELALINRKGKFSMNKTASKNQVFSFKNDSSNDVYIDLIPTNESANIRINQIISPSNKSDGPFGRDLIYHLDEKGFYQIQIGESLMKGDPFRGKYTLKLQLK